MRARASLSMYWVRTGVLSAPRWQVVWDAGVAVKDGAGVKRKV